MSTTTVLLGKKIRSLRLEHGWTQESLAEKSDLHVSYIIALEKGTKSASVDTLKKSLMAFLLLYPICFRLISKQNLSLNMMYPCYCKNIPQK